MQILTNNEELLALSDLVADLPVGPGGRKTSVRSLFRWASVGVRGTKLEVVEVGGRVYSSHQALRRFLESLVAKREQRHAAVAAAV